MWYERSRNVWLNICWRFVECSLERSGERSANQCGRLQINVVRTFPSNVTGTIMNIHWISKVHKIASWVHAKAGNLNSSRPRSCFVMKRWIWLQVTYLRYRTLRPQDTSAQDRGKVGTLRTQCDSDETQLHRWFGLNLLPKCPDTSGRSILWTLSRTFRGLRTLWHQFCVAEESGSPEYHVTVVCESTVIWATNQLHGRHVSP